MTAVDGQAITYDGIGNPTSYYNGCRYTMSWTEGRKLASLTYNGQTMSYEYDHNGIRTKKTKPDGSYIRYEMVAGKAVGETRYNAAGNVSLYMRYTFDESGNVVGISLWYPGDTVWTDYYFAKNLQGDVLAVYAASDNTCVAAYTYDSWGNILTQYGSLADINPFRYRGYYYDNESWFYYLQSRYYDPSIGRFINEDAFASTGQGLLGNNMFAYCLDNPINFLDENGEDAIWIQEKNSAFGCGHSGLMVQDEEGNWWYFYWGPLDPDSLFSKAGMVTLGTDVICVFMKVNVVGYNINSPSGVRGVLLQYNDARVGEQADDITNILYYKGDYINTYNFLCNLSADANDGSLEYHLLTQNCSIMSVTAMQQSSAFNHKFRVRDAVIPNFLYRKLTRLHQWSGGVGSRSNTKICI